jgi:hypothetical protein
MSEAAKQFESVKVSKFEILTVMACGNENCWTEDGLPVTFHSMEAAEKALAEYLADVEESVASGDLEEGYTEDDFEIVRVID